MADEPYDDTDAVTAAEAGSEDEFNPSDLFDADYESVEQYKQREERALDALNDVQDRIKRWEKGLEKDVASEQQLKNELKRIGRGGSSAGLKAKGKSMAEGIPWLGDKIADRSEPLTHGELLQAQYNIVEDYYQDVAETLHYMEEEIENWDKVVKSLDNDIDGVIRKRERLKDALEELNEERKRLAEEYRELRAEEVGDEYTEDGEAYELGPNEDDVSLEDMSADLWQAYKDVDEVESDLEETKDEYADLSADLNRFDRLKDDATMTRDLQRKTYESVRSAHENLGEKIQVLDQFQSGITEQAKLQRQTQQLIEATSDVEDIVNTAVEFHTEWSQEIVEASEEVRDRTVLREEARSRVDELLADEETKEEKQAAEVEAADKVAKERRGGE